MTHRADEAPVVVETGNRPVASVIWLHGLGADGHDFEPIVPELDLPVSIPVRFVFPHAPFRPVTINGGYVMRAWYDLAVGPSGLQQNAAHIRESELSVRKLIEDEMANGRRAGQIVVAGFSQGAAMAVHTGLRFEERLAGIMSLSMPIPLPERIAIEMVDANRRTPVFLTHGTQDQVIPFEMGVYGHSVLENAGVPVEWHRYEMGHSVCEEEVADIRNWLVHVLGGGNRQRN